jgi:3-hydroxyisobutyrate dehydrogenase-like beta-hydroxyacid dehydrogenase
MMTAHHQSASAGSHDAIGVIGLGLVGRAIATRLLRAQMPVIGFDVQPSARAAFEAAGGTWAASAREIGRRCSCVALAVFDTNDVLQVLEAPDGLLATGHQVNTVIDCSTGDPQLLQALAARLQSRGIVFVEAPLSGSSQQIADGEATQLLGGEAAAIASCEAVLGAMAQHRIHVGAAGMAARAKLATNLVLGLNRAVLAEGMAFAESLGIPADTFLQLVLATPARSAAAEVKGPMMASGRFEPQSRIRQHLKDVDLMLRSAQGTGQLLPLSQVHARLLRDALAAGDGDLDNAAIILQMRRERLPPD